jgi:integrase
MMAPTKKKRWSYSAGERGRNRVRAFEHCSGVLMLEFSDQGRRKRISLGHRDRNRAKEQADLAAAGLGTRETLVPGNAPKATLETLFEKYLGEVTPRKCASSQKHDHRVLEMYRRYWGPDRVLDSLSVREWDNYIADRRSGRICPPRGRGRPVGERVIEQDLRLLQAVLNWATLAGNREGRTLLSRNPLKGLRLPKEKNPNRVILTEDEYLKLLQVAPDVDWRFHVALVLAHETGHRIGAIRKLQWSDIDEVTTMIRWRAEHEKTGYEHHTPMSDAAVHAVMLARNQHPGIGDSPLLPAPKDPSEPSSRHLARDWWKKAEAMAGLEPKRGRGWHSLRRKFASDLMDQPLKILCELGGWKDPSTILKCYQHPDEAQLREALEDRRRSTA